MNLDVLAIGELLADLVTEDYVNDLREAKSFHIYQGGSPANVCANLHWLGVKAALVSCVGNDGVGEMIIDTLRKTGLTTQYIYRSDVQPTSLVLVGRSKGTPDFIAYRMADRYIPAVDDQLVQSAQVIHTCAFALSKEPARGHILQALHRAKAQQKSISVDWNYAPEIWQETGQDVFTEVVSLRPLLKVSMDDVCRFTGQHLSIEEARTFLSGFHAKVLALTCGKDGVWYREDDQPWTFKPADMVKEVVDSTGAGDAFWSGFLSAFLQQKTTHECIGEALRLAGRKVQHMGPLYVNA